MPLAVRTSDPRRPRPQAGQRVGDRVAELASIYAACMNGSRFAADLRARAVDRRRYITFLCTMYPVVVGFNRGLIQGIAKVDHVRQSVLVKALAEQLQEEQVHNQLWRDKLALFGVDHHALYSDLVEYLSHYTAAELEMRTQEVLARVAANLDDGDARVFTDAVFPDAVLALYHHLWLTGTHPEISHWEHFASHAGVEMVIWEVVSTSILPGVLGNPELDLGPASTQWWREHGELPGTPRIGKTDEQKHLELSRLSLNRSDVANQLEPQVIARAEDTMRLFAATLLCEDRAVARFPLDRYVCQTT